MAADKSKPSRTFGELSRNQLAIYAKELQEHYQQGTSLRRELEENNRDLEQRVRELTALNRLFQEHLRQRLSVVDAYSELFEGLQRLSQETVSLTERAKSERLTNVGVKPGLNPDATVTLLFCEVESPSLMMRGLESTPGQDVLGFHIAIVRQQVTNHAGFQVKAMDDGFMLAFSSARRALQCAIAIQRAIEAHNQQNPDEQVLVRMGMHTGEVIKEVDDFYGQNVILASRIAQEARGGQILVSSLVKELTADAGDIQFDEKEHLQLKWLDGTYRVYRVLWE